ncbi:MAG: bifunctional nicotinamidase/pyrazinamidase [Microbacter sp.]
MEALIIIDMQNDFMPGGALAVPEADQMIPVINTLQTHFELVVATQDWHPRGHVSFASSHAGKKPFEKMMLNGIEETLWPDHCIQGTRGADFSDQLNTQKIAAVFRKGMNPKVDSYSGFYDNHHLIATGLSGYLREKKIRTLYFCGVAADVCVYFSVMDALAEGFQCVFVQDASQPLYRDQYAHLLNELSSKGVSIVSSWQLVNH